MRKKHRTEKLDMETVVAIRMLAREYGLKLSGYYDRSELNAPGDGRLSYMAFLAVMAGGDARPEQEARVARSLATVRQSLRASKTLPVVKGLARRLAAIAAIGPAAVDAFAPGGLGEIRRRIEAAEAELGGKRAK